MRGPTQNKQSMYTYDGTSKLEEKILENSLNFFFENAQIQKEKSAKICKWFKMADF